MEPAIDTLGIVCGRCDSYAVLGTEACPSCGNALALEIVKAAPAPVAAPPASSAKPADRVVSVPKPAPPSSAKAPPSAKAPSPVSSSPSPSVASRPKTSAGPTSSASAPKRSTKAAVPAVTEGTASSALAATLPRAEPDAKPKAKPPSKSKTLEELMDQAKNFVCRSCSTAVPLGHKFCGRCGAPVPPEIITARTQFFGQLQAPGKAKLILIRGEGVEGLSYQLNAEQHVVGRSGQLVFPDDPFVSPKHANFFYRNGQLVVRDEGSVNGVYLRVKGSVDIQPGDFFLAGEQVFVLEATPKLEDQPGPDGTFFYSSPKHQSPFRITQMLQGGAPGMTVCARGSSLQIGREGGDLNFPSDLYMSAAHCRLEDQDGKRVLTDLGSRNGTYVRLKAERELVHGDYLFIGRKLLRVEVTAA